MKKCSRWSKLINDETIISPSEFKQWKVIMGLIFEQTKEMVFISDEASLSLGKSGFLIFVKGHLKN